MSQNNPNTIDQFYYGSIPKQAVVEQNQTYLAYFDGVGGTGPEVINQTAYFIKYLIDTEGNVTNPEPNNIALLNLIDNYESGKKATVTKLGGNITSPISNGTHPITYVGRIAPILVTETGSGKPDYIVTMSFIPPTPPGTPVENISALMRRSGSIINPSGVNLILQFQDKIYGDAWTLTGTYSQLNISSADAGTRIKLKASIALSATTSTSNSKIRIRIKRAATSGQVLADSGYIPIEVATVENPSIYTTETDWIESLAFSPGSNVNSWYFVTYDISNIGASGLQIVGTDNNCVDTYLLIQQENAPYDVSDPEYINGENAIFAPYNYIIDYPLENYSLIIWNSSSAQLFNSNKIQTIDPSSSAFGFSDITIPFGDTKAGDYIRFEYNPNQVYLINDVKVKQISSSAAVEMKVTPNIGGAETGSGGFLNTNISSSHFCIYRVINDGTYVVLNIPKDIAGGTLNGILQPEFTSQELKNNYDKIISDLTQKNIIT